MTRLAPIPEFPRRLAYLGTPEMAVAPLRALVTAGFEIALVVTRIDKRRGRGGELSPSPVKAAALELGLPVAHRVDDIVDARVDLGVVVAFGQLIKPHVLAAVPMVNIHFSLLPRWRGAAPVERALLAGDAETGTCLMQLEEGLDTGPVFDRIVVPIGDRETAADLRVRLVEAGTDQLVRVLRDGLRDPRPQIGETTYAAKIDPAELAIDWHRPAAEIDRLVRLGGAWTMFRGKRLKVLAAAPAPVDDDAPVGSRGDRPAPGAIVGDLVATPVDGLRLIRVQPEGKPPMDVAAWRNGARPVALEVLGAPQ